MRKQPKLCEIFSENQANADLFLQTQPWELSWGTAAVALWWGCWGRTARGSFLVKCGARP